MFLHESLARSAKGSGASDYLPRRCCQPRGNIYVRSEFIRGRQLSSFGTSTRIIKLELEPCQKCRSRPRNFFRLYINNGPEYILYTQVGTSILVSRGAHQPAYRTFEQTIQPLMLLSPSDKFNPEYCEYSAFHYTRAVGDPELDIGEQSWVLVRVVNVSD